MAEPAWLLVAVVRIRLVPDICALPLSVQPPPGGGTAVPVAGAAPVPVTGADRVCVPLASVQVSWKLPATVPMLAGVKVIGTLMSYPGLTGRPALTGSGAPNGTDGTAEALTVAGRLPVFAMSIVWACCWPSGTEPKLIVVGVGVSWLTAAIPVPESGTVRLVPSASVIVKDPVPAPAAVGR